MPPVCLRDSALRSCPLSLGCRLLPEPRERDVVREAACGGRDCPYLEAGAGVDVLGAGAAGAGAGVGADGAGTGVEGLGAGVTAAWT
jgi:hypothetical protein